MPLCVPSTGGLQGTYSAGLMASRQPSAGGQPDGLGMLSSPEEFDMEDEHLEIEGAMCGSGRQVVYLGTWRGLEVAIKTVVFEVRTANNSVVPSNMLSSSRPLCGHQPPCFAWKLCSLAAEG
jgi:hypothetical protein